MNDLLVRGPGIRAPKLTGDVGYDLLLAEDLIIDGPGFKWCAVDASVKLPHGTWGLITARSSAAVRHEVLVVQGVIDNGYTGPLKVGVFNPQGYNRILRGQAIAQLILMPVIVRDIRTVLEFVATPRGDRGFGSTDG